VVHRVNSAHSLLPAFQRDRDCSAVSLNARRDRYAFEDKSIADRINELLLGGSGMIVPLIAL